MADKNHKNAHDNVEIFTQDSIITLYDDEEKPIDFFEIASVEYEEKFYGILQPVEVVEGIGEDEAVIFEYSVDEEGGEKLYKPIFDEKLLEKVFSLYLTAAADFEASDMSGGGGCGSGCGGCGGGCGGATPE
ncbi:MAG: DUF1292 domain-containing protein [Firmicutes bacterium]|nr:DUF1292 domain-containing protein [Bacillota bacterium]